MMLSSSTTRLCVLTGCFAVSTTVQRCRASVLGEPLEQAAVNARTLCNQLDAIAFENVRMGDHFLHIAHLRDGANRVRIFVWRVGEADVRNVFVLSGHPRVESILQSGHLRASPLHGSCNYFQ